MTAVYQQKGSNTIYSVKIFHSLLYWNILLWNQQFVLGWSKHLMFLIVQFFLHWRERNDYYGKEKLLLFQIQSELHGCWTTCERIFSILITSTCRNCFTSLLFNADWASLVFFLRFGESFKLWTVPVLSPTTSIGSFELNAILFNDPSWALMTFWIHILSKTKKSDKFTCLPIGRYLLMLMSKTRTPPSFVTSANTVLEYGAQATSPTG